jgi:Zn-dependent protease with chaperone function
MLGVCLVVKLLYIQVFYQPKDDAGLATVMGHEVSHALANHGAQRMSAAQVAKLWV